MWSARKPGLLPEINSPLSKSHRKTEGRWGDGGRKMPEILHSLCKQSDGLGPPGVQELIALPRLWGSRHGAI